MAPLAAFEVLAPGVLTTVQDLGRQGYRQYGIPPSGTADPFSARVANVLVGNGEGAACLETTIMGLKLRVLGESVIAMAGGDLVPTLNGAPLEMWMSHLLVEGDVVAFKGVRSGCRSYLAIAGGIDVPEIMGSASTCLSGKFGGLEGRALRRGDVLYRTDCRLPLDRLGFRFPREWVPVFDKEPVLNVIPGPQEDHFTEKGFGTFRTSSFFVTRQSDRMGIRLEGPPIERRPGVDESIISEGLLSGAIQVPGDGKPIILLTELVTGGYAKIATVISADLPKVAQLKPGDRVRFKPIQIDEAYRALEEQEARLNRFKDTLQLR